MSYSIHLKWVSKSPAHTQGEEETALCYNTTEIKYKQTDQERNRARKKEKEAEERDWNNLMVAIRSEVNSLCTKWGGNHIYMWSRTGGRRSRLIRNIWYSFCKFLGKLFKSFFFFFCKILSFLICKQGGIQWCFSSFSILRVEV